MVLIYVLINRVNGKRYVGQTTMTLERRWSHHRARARMPAGGGTMAITGAIRKYGEDAWDVVGIQTCISVEEMAIAEAKWIEKLGSHVSTGRGYNLSIGGETGGVGVRHTEETRRRWSEQRKGRVVSEEGRASMSAAQKGRPKSDSARAAIAASAAARAGWKHTEESKAKIRDASRAMSEETRAKISAANTGQKRSEETKARMRAARASRANNVRIVVEVTE